MFKIQIMTTEEYEKEGFKHIVLYDFHYTPFGKCLIGILNNKQKAICHLTFVDGKESEALDIMKKRWPRSQLLQESKETLVKVNEIFSGKPPAFSEYVKPENYIVLKGTEFQLKVWQEMIKVLPGSTTTYERIAQAIDHPKAVRAVANALGINKIGYLVPCHRVFGKNGSNKYEWGVERKNKILEFERKNAKLKT